MDAYLAALVVAAIAGAGVMSGLLFAFSCFVMRALLQLPHEYGMQAMQRINVVIINPLFLFVFMGSAVVAAVLAAVCAFGPPRLGGTWLLGGAIAYLVGPFGITMAFNVPLNNRLAAAAAAEASSIWPAYAANWLFWNHARTALALVCVILLAVGLYALE